MGTNSLIVALVETYLATSWSECDLPEISVHDEASNAQAEKCIFPFVRIS